MKKFSIENLSPELKSILLKFEFISSISDLFVFIFPKLDEMLSVFVFIFPKLDEMLLLLSSIFDKSSNLLSYPLSFNKF